MHFVVVCVDPPELLQFTLPLIHSYCKCHGYTCEEFRPDRLPSQGPSWIHLEAFRRESQDFIVAWDAHLVPLPHAPPIAAVMREDALNLTRIAPEPASRRKTDARAEHYDSVILGASPCIARQILEESDNPTFQSPNSTFERYLERLTTGTSSLKVAILDDGWNEPVEKSVDLGNLQWMFAANLCGNRWRKKNAAMLIHAHYFGPSFQSLHAGMLIEIIESLNQNELHGVEVGVFRGETSRLLLRRFPRLKLVLVDSWSSFDKRHRYHKSGDGSARLSDVEQSEHREAALANTRFAKNRRRVIIADSVSSAAEIEPQSQDFVFLDADHTYSAVHEDITAWWPAIRSTGILCGHDYGHPRDVRGVWGVRKAVDEFAASEGLPVSVGRDTVWWIHKP